MSSRIDDVALDRLRMGWRGSIVMIQARDVTREPRRQMAEIARKIKRDPSDLTEEWAQVAPLMPEPTRRRRKPSVDQREMLKAVRYLACPVVVLLRAAPAVPHHP
ncbi:transposase [Roseococcus pinisoli]|uniref:transposase n=1 Tax=Roseococcus pinisoli TaxID=2835040 RepID=UPI0038CF5D73